MTRKTMTRFAGRYERNKPGLIGNRRLLAVAAALAVIGASSGAALASTPYSVKLSVPSLVPGTHVKVKASGSSQNASHLTVYRANGACASSAKAEAKIASRIINKNETHSYAASKNAVAGAAGNHHVCAYLTSTQGSTLAHATATYTALTGGY